MVGLSGTSSLLLAHVNARDSPQNINSNFPSTCLTHEYDAFDSQGKDPCQVATALFWSNNQCYSSSAPPPGLAQLHNNQCLCNTVFYSLVYVCGLCTDKSFLEQSWPDYSGPNGLQCNPPEVTTYPPPGHSVPADIVIPPWASLPLVDDKVDLQHATQTQTMPAATSPASQPTPTTSPPIGPSASTIAPIATSPPTATNPASQSPTSSPTTTETQESTTVNTSDASQSASPSSSSASAAQSTTYLPASTPTKDSSSVTGGATAQADATNMKTSTSLEGQHTTSSGRNPANTITTAAASTHGRSHLGAILGAVFGVIAASIFAICVLLCLARRRRRRREKEAMLASGPLDWWRRTDILPRATKREPSESSTIKADELDDDDDMETLHATSVEKKSVTYGEYPDL